VNRVNEPAVTKLEQLWLARHSIKRQVNFGFMTPLPCLVIVTAGQYLLLEDFSLEPQENGEAVGVERGELSEFKSGKLAGELFKLFGTAIVGALSVGTDC